MTNGKKESKLQKTRFHRIGRRHRRRLGTRCRHRARARGEGRQGRDLRPAGRKGPRDRVRTRRHLLRVQRHRRRIGRRRLRESTRSARSEEHTSELQSLMRISYAVFCLKKKTNKIKPYIFI